MMCLTVFDVVDSLHFAQERVVSSFQVREVFSLDGEGVCLMLAQRSVPDLVGFDQLPLEHDVLGSLWSLKIDVLLVLFKRVNHL